uniref:Uncharacterized protein n=1 Tax=Syphacia muris TaxID=451379 RepID=A0A0N5A8M2_9BILA
MNSLGLISLTLIVAAQSAPVFVGDYGGNFWRALSEWSSMKAYKKASYDLSKYFCAPEFRVRHQRDTNSTRLKRNIGCSQPCFCQQPNCCCKPICLQIQLPQGQLQLQPQSQFQLPFPLQLQSQPNPCCCPQMCSQPSCSFGNPSSSCCKIQPPPACYTVQPPPQCMLLQPPPIPIMVQPPPVTCRVQSAPMCLRLQSQSLCCCNQNQQPTCNCCQQQPACSYQPACCGNRKRRSLDILRHKIMDKNAAETRALTSQMDNDKLQNNEGKQTESVVSRPERDANNFKTLFKVLEHVRSIFF